MSRTMTSDYEVELVVSYIRSMVENQMRVIEFSAPRLPLHSDVSLLEFRVLLGDRTLEAHSASLLSFIMGTDMVEINEEKEYTGRARTFEGNIKGLLVVITLRQGLLRCKQL